MLSYDVASGSEITSCNKIDKPLVVYRFFGKRYEITLLTSRIWQNTSVLRQKYEFKTILMSNDK